MSDAVLISLITGGFGLLAALMEATRRQNNRDHAVNSDKLDILQDGHDRIERKVDKIQADHLEHIRDHAKGEL